MAMTVTRVWRCTFPLSPPPPPLPSSPPPPFNVGFQYAHLVHAISNVATKANELFTLQTKTSVHTTL